MHRGSVVVVLRRKATRGRGFAAKIREGKQYGFSENESEMRIWVLEKSPVRNMGAGEVVGDGDGWLCRRRASVRGFDQFA